MNITKICPHCKIEKEENQFYKRRQDKNLGSYCKCCTKLQATTRQQKVKEEAINYKGGKCISCNYDSYQGALEFHHLDPSKKDFGISASRHLSFEKIKSELDKCILLCANCHREIHGNKIQYNLKSNSIIKLDNIQTNLIWKPKNEVINCIKNTIDIKEIELRLKNKETLQSISHELNITSDYLSFLLTQDGIYTSEMPEQQDILHPKKIQWPSIEEMQKLVWEKPASQLSEDLGVSDVAIAKFCKKHSITKPNRGYWAKLAAGKL